MTGAAFQRVAIVGSNQNFASGSTGAGAGELGLSAAGAATGTAGS